MTNKFQWTPDLSKKYCYTVIKDVENQEFPIHPDRVSKIPAWTDRMILGLPVLHLYGAVFGFCAVYIIGGLMGVFFGFSMEYMNYFSVAGLAVGYLLARFVGEPVAIIPFEEANHEQQTRAVAEMFMALEEDEIDEEENVNE